MNAPASVRRATTAWSIAVACGVIESGLAVLRAASENALGSDVASQLAIRLPVFAIAGVLIFHFARGRRWARTSLTVMLSVLGLASMVVPAALEIAGGATPVGALGGDGPFAWPFLLVRLIHIVGVVAATWLMFQPTANRYFTREPAGV